MKNWKHYGIVCLMAIIVFAFISCEEEKDDPPYIIREFNDLNFRGKSLTIIDETNNNKNLKERGISQKMQDGLDTYNLYFSGDKENDMDEFSILFFEIINTGEFKIIINTGENYEKGYIIDGFKVYINDNQLLGYTTAIHVAVLIDSFVYDIYKTNNLSYI